MFFVLASTSSNHASMLSMSSSWCSLPWFSKLSHTTSHALFPITVVATIGLSALGSFVMVSTYSSLPSLPSSSSTSHVSPSSFSSSPSPSFPYCSSNLSWPSSLSFTLTSPILVSLSLHSPMLCLCPLKSRGDRCLLQDMLWHVYLYILPFCNPQGFLLTIVPIKVVLSAFGGSTKHILTTINLDDCPWIFSHRDWDSSLPWLWFLRSSSILLPFVLFSFFIFLFCFPLETEKANGVNAYEITSSLSQCTEVRSKVTLCRGALH